VHAWPLFSVNVAQNVQLNEAKNCSGQLLSVSIPIIPTGAADGTMRAHVVEQATFA
jgi:hypothetical protein